MLKGESTAFVCQLVEDKCDPVLGRKVHEHLKAKGLDNTLQKYDPEQAHKDLADGIGRAFYNLGLDPNDPSTQDTPRRFATMMIGELTKGLNYDFFPKCTAVPNGNKVERTIDTETAEGRTERVKAEAAGTFVYGGAFMHTVTDSVGAYNQMVLVRDIQTMSLCEHHLQTIDGVTHVAYIPGAKVLGLSKFARVVDFFARRPQIQERMTDQIFEALTVILETQDIAVVQDATHFCMRARGAMQANARTQTDKLGGRFLEKPPLRQEFFDAIRSKT